MVSSLVHLWLKVLGDSYWSLPYFLFLIVKEKKNALQYIKVFVVLDPTFSDEIPFCFV